MSNQLSTLQADPVAFDPRHRPLFATSRWGVLLYRNQTYLGRSLVYLRTRALSDVLELTRDERDELWDEVLPALASGIGAAFGPDRLNYAHLANRKHHVHWHVVPRWGGDTNFMPVVAESKVMVEHLHASWDRLRPLFDAEYRHGAPVTSW